MAHGRDRAKSGIIPSHNDSCKRRNHHVNGRPWQLRRDRKGRLVLLDFWHTECGPCRAAIRHLNWLQRQYGPDVPVMRLKGDADVEHFLREALA